MTNDYRLPEDFPRTRDTPAHGLARSRLFLLEEDVDLIVEAVHLLDYVPSPLIVYDLGAGSGTTAAAVIQTRTHGLQGTTVDISQENLDWSRKFVTQTWPPLDEFLWENPAPDFPPENPYRTYWSVDFIQPWVTWRWVKDDASHALAFGEMANLFLIDASHEYEETASELTLSAARSLPDHLVWMHDYRGDYPGVTRAVDEAIAKGFVSVVKEQGLGILLRHNFVR